MGALTTWVQGLRARLGEGLLENKRWACTGKDNALLRIANVLMPIWIRMRCRCLSISDSVPPSSCLHVVKTPN
jgi:hypothetical protein